MNPELHHLLDRLSLRKNVPHAERIQPCIENSRELAVHGEEGVAFENLCQNLFEWDFPLKKEDYAEIVQLGRHYRFDEPTWSFLTKLLEPSTDWLPSEHTFG